MTASNRQIRSPKHLLRGLLLLCIMMLSGAVGFVSTAHAELVCQQIIEVAQEDSRIQALALSEAQVVWRTKKAIKRYDITAQSIHTVAENVLSKKNQYFVEVNGDHIIWTDRDHHIYLHTISTGDTIKVSRGIGMFHRPLIDSEYIVYARPKKNTAKHGLYRLFAYEIATGLTTHVTSSAYGPWGMGAGRVVYYDQTQIQVFDIAAALTEGIVSYPAVFSATLDGQYLLYEAAIPKSSSGFDWMSREVFLYDLNTQAITQITDAGYRTQIYGAWMDADSDTVVWGQISGLSDDGLTYFYDISTGEVSGGEYNIADYYEYKPLEIDGRFIGAYDYYYDSDLDWDFYSAAVYDRVSRSVLPLVADGYNTGHGTQLAGGRAAWVAQQMHIIDYEEIVTQRAIMLVANCAATPIIHRQSKSADVLSGRPQTLLVEVAGDLPITYQWYQGEAGDTALPVGENSPTYITPDLVTPVSYWVRLTNPVGVTDSETITLSPAVSYQLVGNEGFETPLNQTGGFWDDFWIDRDFPRTQRVCNKAGKIVAFEGECAYRFGKPRDKYVYTDIHYIDQSLALPHLEVGDVLTVSAYVNSVNASDVPYIRLEVGYDDHPDSVLTLEGDPNAVGYTLMTGSLTLTNGDIWDAEIVIGYPGKKGRVFFDAVRVVASAGDAAPVLLPVPDVPGDLRSVTP